MCEKILVEFTIKLSTKEIHLKDESYMDYRFSVISNKSEILSVWLGNEPSENWDVTAKLIGDSIRTSLMKRKPNKKEGDK